MNWSNWIPRETATLCFIRVEDRLLLIRKKRGLGAGKINAPGGRIEPGETAREAAVRETGEEVGVVPHDLEKRGELHFQFLDGYSLHCTVFLARGCTGEPVETDEADPFWCAIRDLPYQDMWADDLHWLPLVIDGKNFLGYFEFDDEKMLSHRVEIVEGFSREDQNQKLIVES